MRFRRSRQGARWQAAPPNRWLPVSRERAGKRPRPSPGHPLALGLLRLMAAQQQLMVLGGMHNSSCAMWWQQSQVWPW